MGAQSAIPIVHFNRRSLVETLHIQKAGFGGETLDANSNEDAHRAGRIEVSHILGIRLVRCDFQFPGVKRVAKFAVASVCKTLWLDQRMTRSSRNSAKRTMN